MELQSARHPNYWEVGGIGRECEGPKEGGGGRSGREGVAAAVARQLDGAADMIPCGPFRVGQEQ